MNVRLYEFEAAKQPFGFIALHGQHCFHSEELCDNVHLEFSYDLECFICVICEYLISSVFISPVIITKTLACLIELLYDTKINNCKELCLIKINRLSPKTLKDA